MGKAQIPRKLTDTEWNSLRSILEEGNPYNPLRRGRGRPPVEDLRSLAEACLFRSFHSLSTGRSHAFNWNALPGDFDFSGSTANRRFRAWHDSGAWPRFWAELHQLRAPRKRARPRRPRQVTPYPASDLVLELQRAYRFFNEVLFGSALPESLAIMILPTAGHGDRLGYFCGRAWAWGTDRRIDLIAISGIAVGRGPETALETLIHEMVHHRNHRVPLVDCTNHGRYHNRHFRDAAVLAGLTCGERDKDHGYARTALGERARWAIARLRPKERLFRTVPVGATGEDDGEMSV